MTVPPTRLSSFYKAAGIHIKELKAASKKWEAIVREQCGLGRSRAYELMAIADGRTTLDKVRATTNERKRVHRAKSESVPERTTEPEPMAEAVEVTPPEAALGVVIDAADSDAELTAKIVGCIGVGRLALLIVELQKLISTPRE